jgi:preprotein translocase subunit SecE
VVEKTAKSTKTVEKVKQPGRIARWWRETIGELRKVSWPTPHDAWRLTKIVLVVMVLMSLVLGLLDFVFSSIIRLVLG